MREIMFRGKRMDNGEWIYGNLIGTDVIVGDIVEWDSDYFCTEFWWKVDPETVGQYTGFKDETGTEIYEKGRFRHGNDIGTVVFKNGSFWVDWDLPVTWDKNTLLRSFSDEGEFIQDKEVQGHENR